MSVPIGPGDYVECIKGGPNTVGRIYVCQEVTSEAGICTTHQEDHGGIMVVGLPPPQNGHPWYALCAFRPVYRPKDSIIQGLLKPIDEQVDA